jgi:hypothetical protein
VERRRRGLLGFYIVTGVVLASFVGGWLARTPLQVAYYEWRSNGEFKEAWAKHAKNAGSATQFDAKLPSLTSLVELGPPALPALRRLLADDSTRGLGSGELRRQVFIRLTSRDAIWAITLAVEHADSPDETLVVMAAEQMTGLSFSQEASDLASWWELRGKSKYGRSK